MKVYKENIPSVHDWINKCTREFHISVQDITLSPASLSSEAAYAITPGTTLLTFAPSETALFVVSPRVIIGMFTSALELVRPEKQRQKTTPPHYFYFCIIAACMHDGMRTHIANGVRTPTHRDHLFRRSTPRRARTRQGGSARELWWWWCSARELCMMVMMQRARMIIMMSDDY